MTDFDSGALLGALVAGTLAVPAITLVVLLVRDALAGVRRRRAPHPPVRLIMRGDTLAAQVGVSLAWVDVPLSHPAVVAYIVGVQRAKRVLTVTRVDA